MQKETAQKPTEIDKIRSEIDAVSQDLKKLTKHLEAEGKTIATNVMSNAQDNLSHLKAKAQENISHLQDYSSEQLKAVEQGIKAKPAQSVAIAFGAGLLASFLFSRRA